MPQAFLTAQLGEFQSAPQPRDRADREKVKILVFGSRYGTKRIIHELYRLGFAEVREWSHPLPTGTVGEVVRILTRYVRLWGRPSAISVAVADRIALKMTRWLVRRYADCTLRVTG